MLSQGHDGRHCTAAPAAHRSPWFLRLHLLASSAAPPATLSGVQQRRRHTSLNGPQANPITGCYRRPAINKQDLFQSQEEAAARLAPRAGVHQSGGYWRGKFRAERRAAWARSCLLCKRKLNAAQGAAYALGLTAMAKEISYGFIREGQWISIPSTGFHRYRAVRADHPIRGMAREIRNKKVSEPRPRVAEAGDHQTAETPRAVHPHRADAEVGPGACCISGMNLPLSSGTLTILRHSPWR